jgi:N-acetylmuramoyl-L-alanine amidase
MEDSRQGNNNSTLYKVIAGSFNSMKNAEERVVFFQSEGIESFVLTTTISGSIWYRVQAGAFSHRENAEQRLNEVKKSGVEDAFILPFSDTSTEENTTVNSILGEAILTAEQMNQFVLAITPQAIQLGSYYITYGKDYGIRGDIAFAQAMHETDFFRFSGVVQVDQNNFSGIGATGGDVRGARFSSPEEGVLAHIQHLYAYASTNPLPNLHSLVDPRFHLVTRGSAQTWVALNGKWAVPGDGYGQSIINLYERMVHATT